MKKILLPFLFLFCLSNASAQKITFCPQWTPQAQFAGYYVALAKGFYRDEGLDVDIKHVGVNSTESSVDKLYKGEADIIGLQLLQGIINRSDGKDLVNVMQTTQVSGLWCVSHTPLNSPEDLDGKKIGKWKVGFSEFCEFLEFYKGLSIKWVPFANNGVNLYIYGAVDATLCYSFSEYVSLKLAIGDIPAENVLKFSDFGYDCPEDGIYTREGYYKKHKDIVEKFVRASKKGWDYARTHQEEALAISKEHTDQAHINTNSVKERMMLEEYLRLQVNPLTSKPDYAQVRPELFNTIVRMLLQHGNITSEIRYEDFVK